MASKHHSDARTRLIRDILAERFPNAFKARGEAKVPLAIGIGDDVLNAVPELGVIHVSRALADYCGGPTYLRACRQDAIRYGVTGAVAGVVTASEAAHAVARLAGVERFRKAQADQKARKGERMVGADRCDPATA